MAGRKVFGSEVLTSADVNEYLMSQAVMRFASATARSAQIPAPVPGMLSWLDSTGRLEVYKSSTLGWKPVRLSPYNTQVLSATANWATPNGGQIASSIAVDPTALFGPGIAARVQLDGRCLVDSQAGTAQPWYYNLYRGDGQLLCQDYAVVSGRNIFTGSYTVDVPAGTTASFYPSLTAPGVAANAQTVRTYADFTSNRLIADVFPLIP